MTSRYFSKKSDLFACSMAALLVVATSLRAEEKIWTGAVDGSWISGGNWSPSALVNGLDSVLYDNSSTANPEQTLDQNWSITGLVMSAPGPIAILPGAGNFILTNTGGIDMSAAAADLTIFADYRPINNGTLNVASGRTLTFSNILGSINNATTGATVGAGTVRILGSAQRLTDQFNSVTLVVDGGSVVGNPPVRLSADSGSTVTVVATNNGAVNITSGSSTRIHLGSAANAGSTNHFIVDGGSVTISGSGSSGANGIYVGSGAGTVGILDINNGTVDMSDRMASQAFSLLRIGHDSGSLGIVNLNANGRLLTPRIDRNNGYGIFNFNGGYLQMTTADDVYFVNVDEVNLLAGGGVIDTGNRVVAAVAPLSGPGGLTKLGGGTLTFTSPNHTYAGPTVVSNGTFAITLPLSSSSLTLASNSVFNLTLGNQTDASWSPASITLEGANTLNFTYATASQPSSTLVNAPTLNAVGTNFINVAGTAWPVGVTRLIDYSGSINGDGTFVFGPMPAGLNARLTNDLTTTSIDLIVSFSVNDLEWYGFSGFGGTGGGLWDIATTFNWNNGASVYNEYGTGTNQLGDSVRFTPAGNSMVEIATTVRPSSVTLSNANNTTYSFLGEGKISGPTSLIKEGTGANSALNIATTNDYTGGTFIRVGNLILGAENALPTGGLVYLGSPGNPGSLTFNGFNQTIAGLISTGSGSGNRRVLNSSATPAIFTINVVADQTNSYTHTVGHTGVANTDIANNFSVVKTGPGIQIFNNTGYGGTTTISGGMLLFNGNSVAMTGTVTVQAGGAIGGNGTGNNAVGGQIIVEPGGRLEPGNLAIGTLTVSNTVSLQGEAVMQINRNGLANRDILVANSIDLGGSLTVTNIGSAPQAGDVFRFFIGTLNGNFTSVILPPLASGLVWNTNNLAVNGSIAVDALPQPTFNAPTVSGNELVLSGTGGSANGIYHVLTSTNVAEPLANWTALATNNFNGVGAFSFTNTIAPATSQRFFLLQVP